MPLLTVQQMQEFLSLVSYMPGYTLRIYEGHTEGPMLEIKAIEEDSVNLGNKVPLEIYSRIPPQLSIEAFTIWLFDRLKVIAIHEVCEWFKVDGKCPFNPHASMADRNLLFDQILKTA